jgi:lipoate-protein ligase B
VFLVHQTIPYAEAWEHQVQLHRSRVGGGRPDTVLLLEHRPVYTLGRRTDPSHWGGHEESLRRLGADLHWVNRGGSVTYHGPGQIVVYPILKLSGHARGPKQFVGLLEETVLRLLKQWGIAGRRVAGRPGVWIGEARPAKIASIGIRIEQGVTLHGFSLNVAMDLSPFRVIQPCGFADCRMISIADVIGTAPELHRVKQDLARHLTEVFCVHWPITAIPSLSSSTLST